MKIIFLYVMGMNIIGFLMMRADKRRAVRRQWRISEKTLFLLSLLGGSIGTWSGMYVFRHKTRHWYFVIGMPLILFLQTVFALLLVRKGMIPLPWG